VTGADSPIKSSISLLIGIDSEIQQLLKSLKNLSKVEQQIVIKNALSLYEILKNKKISAFRLTD